MRSGREGGSPSTVIVAVPSSLGATQGGAAMTSSMLHKLQREELLEGGTMALDLSHALHGATLRVSATNLVSPKKPADPSRLRNPRGGTPLHSPTAMSPLHSPRAVSPLYSPRAGQIDSSTVDFQDAILRACSTMPLLSPTEDCPALSRRSKSDISEGRHKSPFSSGRLEVEAMPVEHDALKSTRNRKLGLGIATQEKTAQEWVLLERGKSPRRSKGAGVEVQQEGGSVPNARKSSRSATRRAKEEPQEVEAGGDLGMGDDVDRFSRRGHVRTHARQHKRKASDPVTRTMPLSAAESHFSERPTLEAPESCPPYRTTRSSATASRTRASRDARAPESSDWMQFMGDIFMWSHIPRSALLFGVGCFGILSTSVIQDMHCSAISVLAYIALFYLAATFLKCNFLRGATSGSSPSVYVLTEEDALKLLRLLLPPINGILTQIAELFSGEPTVTLKVAAALWLLAQAGFMVNLWTLARCAYFALFITPKLYSSYNEQIRGQARKLLQWAWATWDACSHKKPVLFATFALLWSFSSVSTRICGAFISVVALRVYQHLLRAELENGNFNEFDGVKPSFGLELISIPQPGFERKP